MKKLLVLALTAAMMLTMASASMAAINLSGDVTLTYNFNDQKDKNEIGIKMDSKLNDIVSFTGAFKWNDTSITGGEQIFWMNEGYASLKYSWGTWKIGLWEVKTYNTSLLDNGDSTFGKMKSFFTVGYATPSFGGFTFGAVFMRDDNASGENDAKIDTDEGAYVLTFAYAGEIWGFDYNYVNTNTDFGSLATATNVYDQEPGFAFNIFVNPLDNLKIYAHLGTDNERVTDREVATIGAKLDIGKFYIQAEYNTAHYMAYDNNGDLDYVESDFNPYGWKLGYAFSNGITVEWRHKDTKDSYNATTNVWANDMGGQELRVMYKFK